MSLDFKLYVPVDTGNSEVQEFRIFETNITHNLARMAREVGLYHALWDPKSAGYERASDITHLLKGALGRLKAEAEYFRQFESSNGWGTYACFVDFVQEVFAACQAHPKALIYTHR